MDKETFETLKNDEQEYLFYLELSYYEEQLQQNINKE